MALDVESISDQIQPASSRRRLLQLGLLAAASYLAPTLTQAAPQANTERILAFHNLHTGERLQTVYWQHGAYVEQALTDINFILRDHRTSDVIAIDTGLLDLLHALQQKLNTEQPFHIISGYRSPKTNALLRRRGRGVAKKSMHMKGQALDLRVPKRSTKAIHRAALALRLGGVGYYPNSGFVHVDTGRVRQWRGK